VIKLVKHTPKKALKSFLKQKPLRSEIDLFKTNLIALLDKISVIEKRPQDESEEHLKNDLRDFLRDTYYRDSNAINTKDKKDLVIHLGKTTDTEVGVVIEAKRPKNVNEMVSVTNANKKALHELILYYLDERHQSKNNQLKQLIITNINEWYIIDANFFDKHIYRNTQIKKLYETKQNDKKDNPFFYEEIAKIVSKLNVEIPCVYFDINDYNVILRNNKKEDDRELIALYKILSPQHLLKIATPNDSNSLNEKFYKELLHIIGLEEAKDGGKNIIRRKKENRNAASLIELTIEALNTEDILHRLPDQSIYGDNKEDKIFNISLELGITWINRILFLKLLEGQLISYHQGNKEYRFLNTETIHDFDELFKLFHKVLAVNVKDRSDAIKAKYSCVPYLNSSLFEISELEDHTVKINSLDNSSELEFIGTTILKDIKKKANKLPTLNYFFQFLDAYDFSSEGSEDVQEDNKTIITASVLGKVFEKINGYKDGSIFTPAFITMYMCKQSIRLAVVEKFNEVKQWNLKQFDELYNKIEDKKEANQIINSLKICDPAVGSGHFLVSALNEMIAIKSELGVLMDEKGKMLRDYKIEIENDELNITDENENIFTYNPKNLESNRVQKTLFQEKQTIIENCLFGVDINPNSVKICRLRLWIELLKNAYYKEDTSFTELETLPNIDINIKCGNSLLSRFALDADLKPALKKSKWNIESYKLAVQSYHSAKNKDDKKGLITLINEIKENFESTFMNTDPRRAKLSSLRGQIAVLENKKELGNLFEKLKQKDIKGNVTKLKTQLAKLDTEVDDIKTNALYKNAFEWRFEFPEVLNNDGTFKGFDLIIGNPPYIQLQSMGKNADALQNGNYKTFTKTGDVYSLFYEKGNDILNKKGILAFITSNKWMRADYGLNTRKYIVENTNPLLLIDFGMVLAFENATVLSNILLFQKNNNLNTLKAVRTPNNYDLKTDLNHFFETNFSVVSVTAKAWVIQTNKVQIIKTKVELQGIALKNWNVNINRGLLTGYNEAFIIDKTTKNKLIANDKNSSDLIKPLLRGKDIKFWQPNFANLWVIFIPKGFTIKRNLPKDNINYLAEPTPHYGNMEYDDAWHWFNNEYPAIANYLLPYKTKASARQDKGDYWWEQRACSYINEFAKPKIVYVELSKLMCFTYDTIGYYPDKTCFFISADFNLHYLIAFLNSKLFRFCFKDNFSVILGETRVMSKVFFEQIPIKQLSAKNQKPFVNLVDKIIVQKQQGKCSVALENKIDELVYKLYNLSEEEIKLIENNIQMNYTDKTKPALKAFF
jgi:hypothetical protein